MISKEHTFSEVRLQNFELSLLFLRLYRSVLAWEMDEFDVFSHPISQAVIRPNRLTNERKNLRRIRANDCLRDQVKSTYISSRNLNGEHLIEWSKHLYCGLPSAAVYYVRMKLRYACKRTACTANNGVIDLYCTHTNIAALGPWWAPLRLWRITLRSTKFNQLNWKKNRSFIWNSTTSSLHVFSLSLPEWT